MNNLPELNNIGSLLLDVIYLISVFILWILHKWIGAHTTAKQRDMLHRFADEAFAFAKTVYVNSDGPTKLAAATSYLSSRLKEKGITVTTDEMRAAIEKAYLAYKAITTQPAATDQPEKIVTVETPAPIPVEVQQIIVAAKALAAAQVNDSNTSV